MSDSSCCHHLAKGMGLGWGRQNALTSDLSLVRTAVVCWTSLIWAVASSAFPQAGGCACAVLIKHEKQFLQVSTTERLDIESYQYDLPVVYMISKGRRMLCWPLQGEAK